MMVFLSIIGSFLKKLLSDPRILIALLIAIVVVVAYFKYASLQSDLEKSKTALGHQVAVSEQLRADVGVAVNVNKNNQETIDQLKKDRLDVVSINRKLTALQTQTTVALQGVQIELEKIKTPPTPLTPYIATAVDGIQKLRDEVQSAPAVEEQPKGDEK